MKHMKIVGVILVIILLMVSVYFLVFLPKREITNQSVVKIGGYRYQLSTEVSRDFFPSSPFDDTNLTAHITITALDEFSFPDNIDINRIWVSQDNKTADLPLMNETYRIGNTLNAVAIHGPRWDTGTYVDLFVELKTNRGDIYQFQTTHQNITRSE